MARRTISAVAEVFQRAIDAAEQRCAGAGLRTLYGLACLVLLAVASIILGALALTGAVDFDGTDHEQVQGGLLLVIFGAVGLPAAIAAGIRPTTRANFSASDSRDRPQLLLRPSVWLPGIALTFAVGAIEILRGEALQAILAFAIAAGACLFMALIWVTRHR